MGITQDNERALVREARLGSAQAFATLLQLNYEAVYRTLVKMTLDPRAAQDAVQDAMESAIRHFQSYDPDKARFSTWLVAVARNRWLDGIRKNRRLIPLKSIERGEAAAAAPDALAETVEKNETLSALGRLKPEVRTPIAMSYLLGYSQEEIAKEMKIPLGTVKSRIFNGLKSLRKELGDHGQ
jgi:RNA polymerase sigma-70 factor (ECF subfamily)